MTTQKKTANIIDQLSSQASVLTPKFPLKKAFSALLALSIVYITFMITIFYGLRSDFFEKISSYNYISELVTVVLLIAITFRLTTYYATPRENFKFYQKSIIAILFIVICIIALSFASGSIINYNFILMELHCFGDIALFALPTTIAGFFIIKKNATTHPAWLGLTTIMFATALGYLGVRLSCSMDTVAHQGMTHLLPVLIYTAIGYFIGRKYLSW